jgi:serine/threonine protein kinase/Tol biopolymer transport system component
VEQRPAFLKQNCTDPSLCAEVERLLANDDKAGGFLADPVVGGLTTVLPESHLPLLAAGTVLAGRFKIIRFVAEGGMGEVYEAEDLELHERLGIKTLRPEVLQQPNAIERFKREVQLARKVTHPNVCRIFDLYRDKSNGSEVVFVTMEFLRGETLAEHVKHQGRIGTQEALPLITQMASALGAAHQAGIVHRDFKPGNVVLVNGAAEARAVVTDFGLAFREVNIAGHSQSGPLWHSISAQGLYGTPAYMAPEQLEGRPATSASDIYALGLVMYEMVTGVRPFKGDTPTSAAVRRLVEAPPTPRKFDPMLSPVWESVIMKCLERDPAKRFQTPQDVAKSLAGAAAPAAPSAQKRKPLKLIASGGADSLARRIAKNAWKVSAALTGTAMLVAGGVWYLNRPLPPPRITAYTQITHDGLLKELVGTDGNRLYFNQVSPRFIAQVGIKGGAISQLPVAMPMAKSRLVDISSDGSNALIQTIEEGHSDPANPFPIWVAPILGGTANRRIGEGWGERFSPDGESVIYSSLGDIFTVRIDGTERKKLVSTKFGGAEFEWSPDGKTIRFCDLDAHPPHKLWEMSDDGTGMHRLIPGWNEGTNQCCGRWMPDGHFFVFLVDDQIWALDERHKLFTRASSVPIQLTNGPLIWGPPIPSKDGTKIFTDGEILRGELSRIDPKTGNPQPFLGGISAESATVSPDGKYVAYVAFPEGTLWKANRDGTSPMQLTRPKHQVLNPRWSPDSKQILFFTVSADHTEIHRISADDGSSQWLLSEDGAIRNDPNWSPDGKRVLFYQASSTRDKGDLRIVDLSTQQETILPDSQGKWSPRWSPDGRYIESFSRPGVGHLWVFDQKLRRWFDLHPDGEVDYPNFSHDGKFIYFLRLRPEQSVFRIPVTGGKEERVVNLNNLHVTGYLGVYMSLDPSDAPLVMRDVGSDDLYALTFEEK